MSDYAGKRLLDDSKAGVSQQPAPHLIDPQVLSFLSCSEGELFEVFLFRIPENTERKHCFSKGAL